jgi:integrase
MTVRKSPPCRSKKHREVRSLPFDEWPVADREAWHEAIRPGMRLRRGGRAAHMKPVTQKDLARRYGYLLDYCHHRSVLDSGMPAGSHVTPETVEPFLAELKARVGSVTVAQTMRKIRRAAELINPALDLEWLREIEKGLEYEAIPRAKYHRLVDADRIVAGGIGEMDDVLAVQEPNWHEALRYRNGLMIALCATCPIRLKNITQLRVGVNFLDCEDHWLISLPAEDTKERRLDERRIPGFLKPYIDHWMQMKEDLLPSSGNALWASRYGGGVGYAQIEKLITETTRKLYGKPVNPHLLRDCAVHFVAIHAGDQMGIASGVLNHTDPRTTEKHYNKGSSIKAAQTYQSILLGGGE